MALRIGLNETVKPRNPQCGSSVRRIQLGIQSLEPAVDGCGFDMQRRTDHFAAVAGGFMSKQFEFGIREFGPEQHFFSQGLL